MKWIQSKYSTTKWLDTDLKSEWVSEKINFNIAISYQRGREFTNWSNYKTQNKRILLRLLQWLLHNLLICFKEHFCNYIYNTPFFLRFVLSVFTKSIFWCIRILRSLRTYLKDIIWHLSCLSMSFDKIL